MKRPASSDDKKKKNKYQKGAYNSKAGSWQSLEHPSRGFMIMCDMNQEPRAVSEAMQLIKAQVDLAVVHNAINECEESTKERDISDEIEEQARALYSQRDQFKPIDFETQCMRLIMTTHPAIADPSLFLRDILDDILRGSDRRTTKVQKIIPIQMTCKANLEDFEQAVDKLCKTYLMPLVRQVLESRTSTPDAEEIVTISGMFRRRAHNTISREFALPLMVRKVSENYEHIKVNIKQPDIVFIVEIIKNACCMTLTTDFLRFQKYNLEAIYNLQDKE
eukprot:Partr_v1_DN28454_c0_g1_i2_m41575 putative THUMP domain containing 1